MVSGTGFQATASQASVLQCGLQEGVREGMGRVSAFLFSLWSMALKICILLVAQKKYVPSMKLRLKVISK